MLFGQTGHDRHEHARKEWNSSSLISCNPWRNVQIANEIERTKESWNDGKREPNSPNILFVVIVDSVLIPTRWCKTSLKWNRVDYIVD